MIKTDKTKDIKIMYYDLETVTLESPDDKCTFWQLAGCMEINGEVVEKFNWLVNPNHDCEYSQDTLDFCKITEDDLATYTNHEEIWDLFVEMLERHINRFDKNDKMFVCGFNNIPFDNPKLWNWFSGMDKKRELKFNTYGSFFWTNPLDCFPYLSLIFIKYRGLFPNFKLQTVAEKLAQMGVLDKKYLIPDRWHDAEFDIEATRDLFHFCVKAFSLKFFEE